MIENRDSSTKTIQLIPEKVSPKKSFILSFFFYFHSFLLKVQIAPQENDTIMLPDSLSQIHPMPPSNTIVMSFKTLKKKKKTSFGWMANFLSLILRTLCFCFCFFVKRRERQKNLGRIKTRLYKLAILSFFTHLVWLIRVMKRFRDRTIYRNMKDVHSSSISMLNDKCYFQRYEIQGKGYLGGRSLMPFLLKLKINKKLKKGLRKILRKCLFYFGNKISLI
jgi:hypothetical protein